MRYLFLYTVDFSQITIQIVILNLFIYTYISFIHKIWKEFYNFIFNNTFQFQIKKIFFNKL